MPWNHPTTRSRGSRPEPHAGQHHHLKHAPQQPVGRRDAQIFTDAGFPRAYVNGNATNEQIAEAIADHERVELRPVRRRRRSPPVEIATQSQKVAEQWSDQFVGEVRRSRLTVVRHEPAGAGQPARGQAFHRRRG
jgi:hypothetical protein